MRNIFEDLMQDQYFIEVTTPKGLRLLGISVGDGTIRPVAVPSRQEAIKLLVELLSESFDFGFELDKIKFELVNDRTDERELISPYQ